MFYAVKPSSTPIWDDILQLRTDWPVPRKEQLALQAQREELLLKAKIPSHASELKGVWWE